MSELLYSIQNIFEASRPKGCLREHECSAYLIPPYQRGYKWGSEVNQPVERLLHDLKQAWGDKKKEYLLQAITVKQVEHQGKLVLEVIDGQQRLTTLVILLHALGLAPDLAEEEKTTKGKLLYCIRDPETSLEKLLADWREIFRSGGGKFDQVKFEDCKNRPELVEEARQDHYYLKCALLRCLSELGENQTDRTELRIAPNQIREFRTFVLEKVKLMVNIVEQHISGETVFGNLNQNRVLLTETELIKGLLLTRVARVEPNKRPRRYREILELRIRLGRKWEEMRAWASQPDVQSLFFPDNPRPDFFPDNPRPDCILGLLKLVACRLPNGAGSGKPPGNVRNPLFEFFFQQPDFDQVFKELETCYARLRDWHEDDSVYNLLGYGLVRGNRSGQLDFLVKCLGCSTRSKLLDVLKGKLREFLPDLKAEELAGPNGPGGLKYGEDKVKIDSVLLALSVFPEGYPTRFNFYAFADESWSLEHVFPQTPFGKEARLTQAQEQEAYEILRDKSGELLGPNTSTQADLLKDSGSTGWQERVNDRLREEPMIHRIGNLCLLSSRNNSSLGCHMFKQKRDIIRRKIAEGAFIPRHTYEVFTKMVVNNPGDPDIWSASNIIEHEMEIRRRVLALRGE